MKAKNIHSAIYFGLWHTQTYDHHTLQSGSHSKPFQPLRKLYNIEKQNRNHDDNECHQQYCIVEIGIVFYIDQIMKFLAERFGFEDI